VKKRKNPNQIVVNSQLIALFSQTTVEGKLSDLLALLLGMFFCKALQARFLGEEQLCNRSCLDFLSCICFFKKKSL